MHGWAQWAYVGSATVGAISIILAALRRWLRGWVIDLVEEHLNKSGHKDEILALRMQVAVLMDRATRDDKK